MTWRQTVVGIGARVFATIGLRFAAVFPFADFGTRWCWCWCWCRLKRLCRITCTETDIQGKRTLQFGRGRWQFFGVRRYIARVLTRSGGHKVIVASVRFVTSEVAPGLLIGETRISLMHWTTEWIGHYTMFNRKNWRGSRLYLLLRLLFFLRCLLLLLLSFLFYRRHAVLLAVIQIVRRWRIRRRSTLLARASAIACKKNMAAGPSFSGLIRIFDRHRRFCFQSPRRAVLPPWD